MAPPLLYDISQFDLSRVIVDAAGIEKVNPHRGDMRMLDGINWIADDKMRAIAFKDCRADEFWVPGHIPGRPLLPGVLMCEAAAQLASYLTLVLLPDIKFLGFTGLNEVKFRGMVVPGDRLTVVGQGIEFRRRRSVCKAQGLVRGDLVFEATITGMPL